MIEGGEGTMAMTIGALSRRTGVPVKTLRQYEDLGLIYTLGRSEGNFRLFDEDALWCVNVVSMLRELGLTIAEIQALNDTYADHDDKALGPRLASVLRNVRTRTEARIAELQERLRRIEAFETARQAELSGRSDFRAEDPRFRVVRA